MPNIPHITSKAVVGCKIESAEGTDAMTTPGTLDAATQIVLGGPVQVRMVVNAIERPAVKPYLSPIGKVMGERYIEMDIPVEVRGRSVVPTAASPLRENPLWLACGVSPTYAASSATYTPNSTVATSNANSTATIYAFLDGVEFMITGARGTVKMSAPSGGIAIWTFTVQGVYKKLTGTTAASAGIIDAAVPAASFDNFATDPPPVLSAAMTAQTFAAVCRSFDFDLGSKLVQRKNMSKDNGYEGITIVDRDPKGSFQVEAVTRATHDFWQKWEQNTKGVLSLTIGTTVGNTVQLTGPKAQYEAPQYDDADGLRVLNVGYLYNASGATGDDEFTVIYT